MLLDRGDLAAGGVDAEEATPICKYFLQGRCFRADCWYSHDLKTTPCRFYAQGACQYGDECQFRHDNGQLVTEAVAALRAGGLGLTSTATREPVEAPPMDESAFPSLGAVIGGGESGGSSASPTQSQPDGEDLASKLKLKRLRQMFPTLLDRETEAAFVNANFLLDAAIEVLDKAHPGARRHVEEPKPVAPSVPLPPLVGRTRKVHPDVGFVETGGMLGARYGELRQEAIQHARNRNRLFQEATSAFVRGDKVAARELSRQGRVLDARMREGHLRAAEEMFAERNSSGLPPNVVDLHGLHVSEAVVYLESFIEKMRGRFKSCHVITGVGHHSQHAHLRRQSQLAPAIERHLDSLQLQWRDASGRLGNAGGVYEVLL